MREPLPKDLVMIYNGYSREFKIKAKSFITNCNIFLKKINVFFLLKKLVDLIIKYFKNKNPMVTKIVTQTPECTLMSNKFAF